MRYPGSGSRARRPSTGPVPAHPLQPRAERTRLARAESRAPPPPPISTIVRDVPLARHATIHGGDAMICRTCHGRGVVYGVPEDIDLARVRPASVPHLVAPVPCPAPGCFGSEI